MIIIKNGTVIDPANDLEEKRDVLLKEDAIIEIAPPGTLDIVDGMEILDASGCWVTPGLIDVHVHLREPGEEWKETIESGIRAATAGGYTALCCMPNTTPTNDNAETTRFIIEKAEMVGATRVYPIGAVSLELEGKSLAPLSQLQSAGCVAFSDDGEPIYNAGVMRRALEWCRMSGVPICCHEEDKSLTTGASMNESALSLRLGLRGMPGVAEDVMVARDIELARFTGGHVHICHVSTARSVELIRRAKADGFNVTAEVTPHHLVLNEDEVREYDPNYKMSPPLREEDDRLALIAGLQDGTLDVIASDHAPHHSDVKEIEFEAAAFGILGLQSSLPLILDFVREGVISRRRAIEVLSSNAARMFNLSGGSLSKGAAADLVVIDPDHSWSFKQDQIQSISFNSPFIDRELKGVARDVVIRGKLAVRSREILI